jgi:hypothetical protein
MKGTYNRCGDEEVAHAAWNHIEVYAQWEPVNEFQSILIVMFIIG